VSAGPRHGLRPSASWPPWARPEILQLLARSQNGYFPVVDAEGKRVGIFSLTDVRTALVDADVSRKAVIAAYDQQIAQLRGNRDG